MRTIRIGTRSSELALWQANTVASQLNHLGFETEIVKIDSVGDIVLNKPLYELGITGVFTKNLDIALLNDKIDIAVHSFKDVPTVLPEGISQAAVLKRGDYNDILILKKDENFFENPTAIIATGSLRRKAQWLYRYPNHTITGLRGNVQTRLQKLKENSWDGAIFAAAGLKRVKLLPASKDYIKLDWMIPAPAQGAVMVAARTFDEEMLEICATINDEETAICTSVEREFLNVLEGGCTAPIGALATIKDEQLTFKGVLFSEDGESKLEFNKVLPPNKHIGLGRRAAEYILERGGEKLMRKKIVIDKAEKVFSTKILSPEQLNLFDKRFEIEMSDFITIKYNRLKPQIINKPIENVIFTSQNAVEALLNNFTSFELQFKNIYCVGKRTKKLIERKIGKVAESASSAKKLAKVLIENLKEKEVTFFCGNKRREELPSILSKNNINVSEIEVYQTVLTPKKVDSSYKAVLFYSPSGIESYIKANKENNISAVCIGDTTAKHAEKYFSTIITAPFPTIENVIEMVNKEVK